MVLREASEGARTPLEDSLLSLQLERPWSDGELLKKFFSKNRQHLSLPLTLHTPAIYMFLLQCLLGSKRSPST